MSDQPNTLRWFAGPEPLACHTRCGRFEVKNFDPERGGYVLRDLDENAEYVVASCERAKEKARAIIRSEESSTDSKRMTFNDMKVCNCADCGRLLLGLAHADWYAEQTETDRARFPPLLAGRINGRPYCGQCLQTAESVPRPAEKVHVDTLTKILRRFV